MDRLYRQLVLGGGHTLFEFLHPEIITSGCEEKELMSQIKALDRVHYAYIERRGNGPDDIDYSPSWRTGS